MLFQNPDDQLFMATIYIELICTLLALEMQV